MRIVAVHSNGKYINVTQKFETEKKTKNESNKSQCMNGSCLFSNLLKNEIQMQIIFHILCLFFVGFFFTLFSLPSGCESDGFWFMKTSMKIEKKQQLKNELQCELNANKHAFNYWFFCISIAMFSIHWPNSRR